MGDRKNLHVYDFGFFACVHEPQSQYYLYLEAPRHSCALGVGSKGIRNPKKNKKQDTPIKPNPNVLFGNSMFVHLNFSKSKKMKKFEKMGTDKSGRPV